MTRLYQDLKDYPETFDFITQYRVYVHAIDDLIDSKDRPTPEEILSVSAAASRLFSTEFWIKNYSLLIVTEQLVNNTYADSVVWEKSALKADREAANTLRHSGLDMFFAAILLTLGRDKLRSYSLEFRTQCHKIQSETEDVK